MALWDPATGVNFTELAAVNNKLINARGPVNLVRRKNAALFSILGKQEEWHTPGTNEGFERLDSITGKDVEVTLLGEVPTPAYVADSAQVDADTLSWSQNMFYLATFAVAHAIYKHPVPHSEFDRYSGSEAKIKDFIGRTTDAIMEGWMAFVGTAIGAGCGSGTAPARTKIGSLGYAIGGEDPSVPTWNSYGGLNRANAGNANYCGNIRSGANLDLATIQSGINDAALRGGVIKLATAGQTMYERIHEQIRQFAHVTADKDWDRFGGRYAEFDGVKFALDYYAQSDEVTMIDPETWVFIQNEGGLKIKPMVDDITKKATYVIPTEWWLQLICKNPGRNTLLYGCS